MSFDPHRFVSLVKGKYAVAKICEELDISKEEYHNHLAAFRDAEREYRSDITKRFQSILNGDESETLTSEPTRYVEQEVNIGSGEMKVKTLVAIEPRSPEEIIELLKIDTSQWKLSQYWNKEKNGKWEISALCSKLKDEELAREEFLQRLASIKLPKIPARKLRKVESGKQKIAGVISLQDLHFGKPGNENMGDIVIDHLAKLMAKTPQGYSFEKIFFVLGGDLLNADTFEGTTTKGTIIENSERTTLAYVKAFEAMAMAIDLLSEFSETVEVVYIPGNHDRLSSFHLAHAIKESFKDRSDVRVDLDYLERKVKVYGDNFFGFEHGDVAQRNGGMVWPTEFPLQWGSTTSRYVFTGHVHKNKTMAVTTANEESGLFIKVLPSLSTTDYYHYKNKWTMNRRSSIVEYYDPTMGLCGMAMESLPIDDTESIQKVLGFS